ncbi:MAG TPA: PqiC family protein [Burkholderiaceae bacterium]|nr:PqiC family protein [Burkholderiaceae bacterium]
MKPRAAWHAAVLPLVIVLAGCSTASPPTHYHSLVAALPPGGPGTKALPAPILRVQVLPVQVPAQVDVPQLVVRSADDSLAVLEYERWIAPLGDEIRDAVALRIDQMLAQASPTGASDRTWRVRIDVQRFDSMLARAASMQVQWSLRATGGGPSLRCQASYEQPVGPGVGALAAGHRALVERLGDVIGRALETAAAGGTPSCG